MTDWERCDHCRSLKIEDEECSECKPYERLSFDENDIKDFESG